MNINSYRPSGAFSSPPSMPRLLAAGRIPCCVPYWDMKAFLNAGGSYAEKDGFYVEMQGPLEAVDEWLPRKWQYRGNPPVPVILPDMLPSTTWEANLRTALTADEWDRLRKFCYQAAGNRCVACGSAGEPHLEAHEAWRFDEKTGVQALRGLLCLCPTCHKCKHLGISGRLGMTHAVHERLMWLNDWDAKELEQQLAKTQTRQEELSARTWALDLSFLRTYGVR